MLTDTKKTQRSNRGKGIIVKILLTIILITLTLYICYHIQFLWSTAPKQAPRAMNTEESFGGQLATLLFINIPEYRSRFFSNLFGGYEKTEWGSGRPSEQQLYILVHNRTNYTSTITKKPAVKIVAVKTKVFADTEIGANEITIDYFINNDDTMTELAFVPETPEFDAETGAYVYHCLIRLDGGNNLPCELFFFDKTPPVITGVHDIEIPEGHTILYKDGVSAEDRFDKNVRLEVETEAMSSKPGQYPVIYSAADESGNEAAAAATVKVVSAEEEWVYEKCDEILAQVLEEGMDQREQARAIYKWIRSNIRYSATPYEDDAIIGAHLALTSHSGDCFTFYAISEALLTRAGITNLHVKRIPESPVDHHWNLVNIDGGWYHFDACPPFVPFDGCVFTDSEAAKYSKMQEGYRLYYYDYIKEDYPAVVP